MTTIFRSFRTLARAPQCRVGIQLAARFSTQMWRSPALRLQTNTMYPRIQRPVRFSTSLSANHTQNDPSRPDLFYHLVAEPRPMWAVSFLESYDNKEEVIGWLPAEGEPVFEDFVENAAFLPLLHHALKTGLAEGVDDIQRNGAIQLQNGWMHVHDERNIPPLGRIGDPEDIIATVLVEDGEVRRMF